MKKTSSKLLFWCWVTIASILITFWWFNSIYIVPFSEYLWSQYNQLLGGQKPGLASDLEFLTVITASAIFIGFFTRLATWVVKHAKNTSANGGC